MVVYHVTVLSVSLNITFPSFLPYGHCNMTFYTQAAKTKQRIREEQMQVTVVERAQQIMVQDQEITRREKELEAQVRKPAEAEKFRLEKLAEANRYLQHLIYDLFYQYT